MNRLLFERETGALGQGAIARTVASRALQDLVLWPWLRFDGGEVAQAESDGGRDCQGTGNRDGRGDGNRAGTATARAREEGVWACQAGVNTLAVEGFEHKLMLTGGADSSIKLWDLDDIRPHKNIQTLTPKDSVKKAPDTHKFGITHLSFYPFESAAFLSSSYDHTLKIYSTSTLVPSASFDLDSIIYTHALSPIASHLLVACCTQHPLIRLVDLNSGASTHSLAGHHGAVLTAAWSPRNDNILASGGTDGTVRLWDVRKASGTLRLLDLEDSVGVLGHDGRGRGATARASAKAHNAAVNGLAWTDDGNYIVSAGHDNAMRVWDADTGANTLAHFGPTVKNGRLETKPLLLSPGEWTRPGGGLLVVPNEGEVLVAELLEGRVLRRLRLPGPREAVVRARAGGERRVGRRVTSLAWRGVGQGFVSGGTDGVVRVWGPMEEGDVDEVEEKEKGEEEKGEKRKRNVLDEVFKELTGKKITFG